MVDLTARIETLKADYREDYGRDINAQSIEEFTRFIELINTSNKISVTATPDGDIAAEWGGKESSWNLIIVFRYGKEMLAKMYNRNHLNPPTLT